MHTACCFTGTRTEVVDKFFEIAGEKHTLPTRTTVPTLGAVSDLPEAAATETTTTTASTITTTTVPADDVLPQDSTLEEKSDALNTEAVILSVLALFVLIVFVALIYYIKKVNQKW